MSARKQEPHWLNRRSVEAMHVLIAEQSGGSAALRDAHLLESALARPRQRHGYAEDADLFELAAALGYGLAKNHPFLDGNKRIAFVATVTFLERNGERFIATEVDSVVTMFRLAAGAMREVEFAAYLRESVRAKRKRGRTRAG